MTRYSLITLSIAAILLASCGSGSGNKSKESVKSGEQPNGKTTKIKTDLEKELVSGKVSSIRQRVYWCLEKFGRLEKGRLQNMPTYDYLKVFNDKGYITEEIHYDANDKIVNMRKLTYTENNLVESEEIYKGEVLGEKIVNTYDDKLRISKKEMFDNVGKVKSKVEYAYNDEKNESDEDNYDSAGKLATKYVNKYENGLAIERAKYWGGGTLAQKEYYNYDKNKLVETVSHKGKEETFDKRIIYEDYKGDNYTVKITYDSNEEEKEKTFYSYDETGNLLAYITYVNSTKETNTNEPDEQATAKESLEESEENNGESFEELVPTESVLSFKGTGNIYVYTFDEQNNWTQKISYKIDKSLEAQSFSELSVSEKLSDDAVRQFYYERIYTYKQD